MSLEVKFLGFTFDELRIMASLNPEQMGFLYKVVHEGKVDSLRSRLCGLTMADAETAYARACKQFEKVNEQHNPSVVFKRVDPANLPAWPPLLPTVFPAVTPISPLPYVGDVFPPPYEITCENDDKGKHR